jgi:hypothetical protein
MRSWLDPYFSIPETSPFPIGASPFRQRGSVYAQNIEFWGSVVPGGMSAFAARLKDPLLERFISQRFEWGMLYDALPSALVTAAVARERGVPLYQHLREHGSFLAARTFTGFSAVLLRVLSTETVATWLPRLSSAFHDFGKVEGAPVGPGLVRGVRTGMPRMFMHVWGITAAEVVEQTLARSGAKSPHCRVLEPESEGLVSGYEVFRVPFEVKWDVA